MSDLAMKVCDQCKMMWPESEKFERGTIMVGKLTMCFPKAVVKDFKNWPFKNGCKRFKPRWVDV